MDNRLIEFRCKDNVLILATSCAAGETLMIDGRPVVLDRQLTLGHKIASRDIQAGEVILKFGFPIGVATAEIACGAHIHVHNMRSDFTPTYIIPETT